MPRFTPRAETYSAERAYVTVNGVNLASTYGMLLTGYSVGVPEPLLKYIDVPGRPGKLDATLALNGKVNYDTRPVTAEFHVRDCDYPAFQTLLSTLLPLLNGTESRMEFSTDPGWYYKGRFSVNVKKSNPATAVIALNCENAFPYKLENTPYTVQQSISGSGDVVCVGKDYNGPVTVTVSAAMTLTVGDDEYLLTSGENLLRELHPVSGNNTLQFTGTGTVAISYERGIL